MLTPGSSFSRPGRCVRSWGSAFITARPYAGGGRVAITISFLDESDLLGLRQDQGLFAIMTIFGLFAERTRVGGFAAFDMGRLGQAQLLDSRPQLPEAMRQGIGDLADLPFRNVPSEDSEDTPKKDTKYVKPAGDGCEIEETAWVCHGVRC